MSDPVLTELAEDFGAAAGWMGEGSVEQVILRLVPAHLTKDERALRVLEMVAVGVVATAPLAPGVLQDLVAVHHTNPVDLLVSLVALFAELDPGADR